MDRNTCTLEVHPTPTAPLAGHPEAAILSCLHTRDGWRIAQLYVRADQTRREQVGDAVALVARLELGLVGAEEIHAAAGDAVRMGYGTLMLTGTPIGRDWLADVIRGLKRRTGLRIVLKLGRRTADELRAWREAGADGYVVDDPADLPQIRALGYAAGLNVNAGNTHQLAGQLAALAGQPVEMVNVAADGLDKELFHKTVALARLILGNVQVMVAGDAERMEQAELALRRGANAIGTDLLALHRQGVRATRAGATLRRRIELIGRAVA